jgi:hypothetical protein
MSFDKQIQAMIVFTLAAIAELRDPSKSVGVHSRYTGKAGVSLSDIFRAQFGTPLYTVERGSNGAFAAVTGPLEAMRQAGKIDYRPVKGGFMIYPADERKQQQQAAAARKQQQQQQTAKAIAARIAAR